MQQDMLVVQDIVGVAKDLGAAITTGVSQHALHGMQKANWAGFGLGLLGCALIQAQKTASVGKSAKEMLERLATLMLDVSFTSLLQQ